MNDLQPWKIWSVTAILVCAILGTTASRVRPQQYGEASTLATAETSHEVPAVVATASSDTNYNQNDAYAFYVPHRSFIGAVYAGGQASNIVTVNNLLYGSGESLVRQTEEYPEPVVDVAQEIIGRNQGLQADLDVANNVSGFTELLLFYNADDNYAADVATDGWVYPSMGGDLAFDATYNLVSPDGNSVVLVDPSDSGRAQMLNLALQNVVLNVAINGSDSNGAVSLVQTLSKSYVNATEQPVELDGIVEDSYRNLAMSGELTDELGDEQEVLVKARSDALLVEAQAQREAVQQQRAEAIYTSTLGRVYLQMNGGQFAVLPQE